ncbi:MAG: tRNA (adenosine(37)-N6)-dimethylallyltransferase MiaA [Ignavibacteria bacterium]
MKKVLAIVGPTASGKTSLSLEVAEKLSGEIISADSRQVYKNIPVATAQPSKDDLKRVKHYFINELELSEEFSAGQFGIKGREIISNIFDRGKLPVITGGSGLYIRSLIDGLFEIDSKSDEIREKLYSDIEKHGEEYLYNELKNIDPDTFEKIPKGKHRRVIRALEVYYATGKKMSDLQNEKPEINFQTVQIGLMYDRKILYERINSRVDEMLSNGLIDEVKKLLESGYHYKNNYSVDTVGIKEVIKYLEGEYDLEYMKDQIKQNSRRYAKRQLTWFRNDKRIHWINMEKCSIDVATINIIKNFIS